MSEEMISQNSSIVELLSPSVMAASPATSSSSPTSSPSPPPLRRFCPDKVANVASDTNNAKSFSISSILSRTDPKKKLLPSIDEDGRIGPEFTTATTAAAAAAAAAAAVFRFGLESSHHYGNLAAARHGLFPIGYSTAAADPTIVPRKPTPWYPWSHTAIFPGQYSLDHTGKMMMFAYYICIYIYIYTYYYSN